MYRAERHVSPGGSVFQGGEQGAVRKLVRHPVKLRAHIALSLLKKEFRHENRIFGVLLDVTLQQDIPLCNGRQRPAISAFACDDTIVLPPFAQARDPRRGRCVRPSSNRPQGIPSHRTPLDLAAVHLSGRSLTEMRTKKGLPNPQPRSQCTLSTRGLPCSRRHPRNRWPQGLKKFFGPVCRGSGSRLRPSPTPGPRWDSRNRLDRRINCAGSVQNAMPQPDSKIASASANAGSIFSDVAMSKRSQWDGWPLGPRLAPDPSVHRAVAAGGAASRPSPAGLSQPRSRR